ncbi:MAG: sensor histidine kinase [Chloroflexi bacterium]|nr:sensor histidine kinase [Ardenticatenaceae bacterium]NOG36306.1 sensor histidine kinase [Chloroflexota bacterium]
MLNTNHHQQTDVWVKWDWLWTTIFYASVAVSTFFMLVDDGRDGTVWLPLALTAVLLLWHGVGLWFAYRGSKNQEARPYLQFFIILGDIGLWFVLVNFSPAYYFVLAGLFSQIFRQLPIPYAIAATLLLITAIIYQQSSEAGQSVSLDNPIVWIYLFAGASSILLGVWMSAIIDQSMQRRQLIEQLERTQAELAATKRHEGMLEERQRLAREIHDTLAQGFTSIVMHLEAAEQAMPDQPETAQKHLEQARTTARASLEQARRVVQDLRPGMLENQSLPDAIRRTAVRWQEETNIPVTTTVTGTSTALHPDMEVTLLRAVQEALNNIRKHARATAVQITLSYMADVVILDVQDNGVGINGAAPSSLSGGYGLQAMRERAAQLGGAVEIESVPGEGTTVVVSIPIGVLNQ